MTLTMESDSLAVNEPLEADSAQSAGAAPEIDGMAATVYEFIRPALKDPGRIMRLFWRRVHWIYFFIMPVFSGVLRLLYRKQETYFVSHFIFTLHAYTAGFLLYTLGALVDAGMTASVGATLSILVIQAYVFLALRRVYGESRLRTVLKQIILTAVHSISALMATIFLLTFILLQS